MRSTPSSASTPAAARLLADLGGLLGSLGLRWYVFGAYAAVAFGRPRMTADVDVTVDLERRDVRSFVDDLDRAGFALRIDLGDDFLRDARLLPLVHRPTAMPLDIMIASTDLHAEFLERRRFVDVGGVQAPMMSPEDLVATKVLAGRRKDLDDVRGVLLEQRDLDLERVRGLVRDLAAAVDEPRLVPRLERLVRSTRGKAAPR